MLITGGSVYLFSSFSFCPFLTDKRSWLRVWRSRRIPLLLLPLLVWIKAHQDHESSPLRDSNLGFTELDLNLRSDRDYSVPGSDRVTSGPVWTGPGTGVIFDSVPVFLVLVWGRSAIIMPTSRPGSEPVEFWVDGSRRDGTVEEFYTLSSELGRSGPHYGGAGENRWVHMDTSLGQSCLHEGSMWSFRINFGHTL